MLNINRCWVQGKEWNIETFLTDQWQCQQTWYHEGAATLKDARIWMAKYSLPRWGFHRPNIPTCNSLPLSLSQLGQAWLDFLCLLSLSWLVWQGSESTGDCTSSKGCRRGNQGYPTTRTSQKSEGKMVNYYDWFKKGMGRHTSISLHSFPESQQLLQSDRWFSANQLLPLQPRLQDVGHSLLVTN